MADFSIVRPEPFVVQGVDGDLYELPRMEDLSPEQLAALAPVAKAGESDDPGAQTAAARDFILYLCPDLAREPLTALAYTQLFAALGGGGDATEGES